MMNQRSEPRYSTSLPVRVFAGDARHSLDGVIIDVSRGGLAVRVPTWADDERLQVELPLHGDRCFLTCAVVAQAADGLAIVLHCALARPSGRQQRFIEALVRSQELPPSPPTPLRGAPAADQMEPVASGGFSLRS